MSEDLIKRSDAAEVVYKALKTPPLKGVLTDTMSLAIALVRDIPSADRPQGKWIDRESVMDLGDGTFYECSNCGKQVLLSEREPHGIDFEACPYCLARMRRFRFWKGTEDE